MADASSVKEVVHRGRTQLGWSDRKAGAAALPRSKKLGLGNGLRVRNSAKMHGDGGTNEWQKRWLVAVERAYGCQIYSLSGLGYLSGTIEVVQNAPLVAHDWILPSRFCPTYPLAAI